MKSTLITDVLLCDGRAFRCEPGSLWCANGVIVGINPPGIPSGAEMLSGGGLVLAPGFIDAHGHSDMALLTPETGQSNVKKREGFAAEIAGNCGLSAFPLTAENREHIANLYRKYPVELNWRDYAGYQARIKASFCQPEVFALCGHNTLRAAVAGYEKRRLDNSDLAAMNRLLAEQFDSGCLGLSAGLLYAPGRHADDREMISLLRTVQRYDRIFALHLRSEGDGLAESLQETLSWCAAAGLAKLHISHLKTSGVRNFGKLDAVFELLTAAEREYGMRITFDRYPYTWSMTQLSVAGSEEALAMTDRAIMEKLRFSPRFRADFRAALASRGGEYWRNAILATTELAEFQDCCGMTIAEIGGKSGAPPEEIALDIIARDGVNAAGAFHSMNEDNLRRIVCDRRCLCGTDETARTPGGKSGGHPRGAGSAARFIRLLLDAGKPLDEAVARLTSDAAETFDLPDFGSFRRGGRARFVLIDQLRLRDRATFAAPDRPSEGLQTLVL